MIHSCEIENYKSIDKLYFELGRINVFIGENGAGKSNIIEAIALYGAATSNKLDNEFLASRGIRVTKAEFMRSAFPKSSAVKPIKIVLGWSSEDQMGFELMNDNKPYSSWKRKLGSKGNVNFPFDMLLETIREFLASPGLKNEKNKKEVTDFIKNISGHLKKASPTVDERRKSKKDVAVERRKQLDALASLPPLKIQIESPSRRGSFYSYLIESALKRSRISLESGDFVVFSPERTALRTFQREGQIEPLGVNGEGLLKLLWVLSDQKDSHELAEIKSSIKGLLQWFGDFKLADDPETTRRIEVEDRFIGSKKKFFDQNSTNEGFLLLLFYFSLFASDLTPKFFAIDNIDSSLNPKACEKLMRQLIELAKRNEKQAILTTHNPAVLDGLNLDDDQQRLFVVSRDPKGRTRLHRVEKPKQRSGESPVRLSEAFLKGLLGGLPKGF